MFKPIGLADDFQPALADEEPQFQPVGLAEGPAQFAPTFQPVGLAEEPPISKDAKKRLDKATPRRYRSIAFVPFVGKIEQEISSEDVAKAAPPKDAGVVRDSQGNIVGERGVEETLTEPENMAIGAAGMLAGGTAIGAIGTRMSGALGKALTGAMETTVPIELGSMITGGISDLGRMAKGAVKGVFKPKAIVEDLTTPAGKVEAMYNASDKAFKELRKTKIDKITRSAKAKFVDVSGNIKDELKKLGEEGEEAVIRHNLSRGASAISDMELKDYTSTVYKGLSTEDEKVLNRIISSRRTIQVSKNKPDIKSTAGLSVDDHTAYLESLSAKDPDKFAVLNQRADEYFGIMRQQLDKLKAEGIISAKSYKALVDSGDYSPRKFIQYVDPEMNYTFGGRKTTVSSSGLKRLGEGSEQALETKSRLLMAEVVSRTNARIMKNRANVELANLAKTNPENGLVRLWDEGVPPGGYDTISAMVNGKQQKMLIPSEYAKEWVHSDPQISRTMAGVIGWLSGSKILKPMATGLNVGFAIPNFARDLAHIYLTTDQYSAFLPKAMWQQSADLISTVRDAVRRKGTYKAFVLQGGEMEYLTRQGRPSHLGSTVDALYDITGYPGTTSEIWSRLALRRRTLRNNLKSGMGLEKAETHATAVARDYLDFAQGGSWIKAMDVAVPYLNASVQGTRGIARYAMDKPGKFVFKVANIGTLATGLCYANRFGNPEAWGQVPSREKVNNFIITTPFYKYDSNGDKRYYYLKIAKDQGQRVFATIFENLAAMAIGEKFSWEQLGQAAEDAVPITPTGLSVPTLSAFLGYAANKNFWRGEDIWRGPKDIRPEEEWWQDRTPEVYKRFGKATGMSPERTKYAVEQVFTSGNMWADMVGMGLTTMLGQLPRELRDKTMAEMLTRIEPTRRVLRLTDPYSKHADDIGDIRTEAATKRLREKRAFEEKAESFIRGHASREEVMAYIMEQPAEQRRNLVRKFNDYTIMGNMPDKKWWIDLKYSDPDTRAELFYRRYKAAKPEEKERLMQWLNRLPGIRSKQFNYRLYRLQGGK